MKLRLGRSSIKHYKLLFVGWFATITFGAALIAACCMTIWSTVGVGHPIGQPARVTDTSTQTTHIYYQGSADLGGIITILILGAVISGFLAVMVATGTFSFAIALRRRDLALLRLLGASKKHIRRLVRSEALLIAIPATVLGCTLAFIITPLIVGALNNTPLANGQLKTGIALLWPCIITFATTIPIALLASRSAVRRAASIHPAEALREANIDAQVMTRGRRVWAWLLMITGLLMCVSAPIMSGVAGPGASIPLAIFGSLALAIAAVLFGPVYLPKLVRLLTKRTTSLPGRLAAASVNASKRRSAALMGPVVALLASVGIMACVLQTTAATSIAEQRARTKAQLVVTANTPKGLSDNDLNILKNQPEVAAVSAVRPVVAVVAAAFGSGPTETVVVNADIPAFLQTQKVTVTGEARTPQGDTVAVGSEFASWQGVKVGSSMQIGFFDQTTKTVKVSAVLDAGPSLPAQVFVSPELAKGHDAPAQEALLTLHNGASAADVAQRLKTQNITAHPTLDWINGQQDKQASLNLLVLFILTVPGSVFTLVAIANTVLMGFKTRHQELNTLRLLGAPNALLRSMVLKESLITTLAGVIVASLLVMFALLCYALSLVGPYMAIDISLPWLAYILLVALVITVGLGANALAMRAEKYLQKFN